MGTIQGPPLKTWDISGRKQFSINERFKLRFQVDFFNIFNRANFRSTELWLSRRAGLAPSPLPDRLVIYNSG